MLLPGNNWRISLPILRSVLMTTAVEYSTRIIMEMIAKTVENLRVRTMLMMQKLRTEEQGEVLDVRGAVAAGVGVEAAVLAVAEASEAATSIIFTVVLVALLTLVVVTRIIDDKDNNEQYQSFILHSISAMFA